MTRRIGMGLTLDVGDSEDVDVTVRGTAVPQHRGSRAKPGYVIAIPGGLRERQRRKRICTGLAASWCPLHGDCTCPADELGGRLDLNGEDCPLHQASSTHAEYAEDAP